MKTPISVLMSIYNGKHWLLKSIPSVLEQSFADFEFLLVNDGSNDETLEVITHFAQLDKRIRVIDKAHSGPADSRNHGIQYARGEWIAQLDADDLCEPSRLEKQYDLAKSNPSLVLLGSGQFVMDESGQRLRRYQYPRRHNDLLRNLLNTKAFFPHSSAFFHTETVKRMGGYRPQLQRAEDFDLFLRLSEVGRLGCIDEPLVSIRQHSGQISRDNAGYRILVDSRVALASYRLRRMGLPDPIDVVDADNLFNVFRQYVESGVKHDCLFEYRQFVEQIKAALSKSNLTAIAELVALSSNSPSYLYRLFQERLYGERLSSQIAINWSGRRDPCAE